MNNNKFYILFVFFAMVMLFADKADDYKSLCASFVQPGEVDINIRTEKDKYCLGEMILLEVEICNITDKQIYIDSVSTDYFEYFGVEVVGSNRPKQVSTQKEYGEVERKCIQDELMPKGVPETLLGLKKNGLRRTRDYTIRPNEKVKFRLSLSLYFDFSTASYGEYSININCDLLKNHRKNYMMPKKELVIKKSCKFELQNEMPIISTTRMTAEYMVDILGREKTIEILCNESEALINEFKNMKEIEWHKSSKYEKLKRLLAISCWASNIHYSDYNLDYLDEHNAMSLDEFEKLVRRCRVARLRMLHAKATDLLCSLEKIDDDKLQKRGEYFELKKLIVLLSDAAQLGNDEKNLEYLEKNNLLNLDELDDLLSMCYVRIFKPRLSESLK